jgi:hypothetical protein
MKRMGKVVALRKEEQKPDKWLILEFLNMVKGDVTVEELNRIFLHAYDEEICEAVAEYLAASRTLQAVKL